jgi:hypothetical protein
MKKLKIFCLFLFLFGIWNDVAYAQSRQKTAYEKKVLEIKKKYIKKTIILGGEKWTEKNDRELNYAGEDQVDAMFFMTALTLSAYPDVLKSFESELKQAEKLKTSVDFQREKKQKEEKARKEKEEKARQAQEAYLKTDRGTLESNVKTAFEEWSIKGEFEKQSDYEERLKNQSQDGFTKICIEKTHKIISGLRITKMDLQPYNTDDEYFIVNFKLDNYSIIRPEWQNKISIPIADAESFKNNWNGFKSEINDKNWCFVENTLCPTFITLYRKVGNDRKAEKIAEKYELPVIVTNQSEITISFDKLGVYNPYLKGFVFNYSDAKAKQFIADSIAKREKLIRDSIITRKYSQKLDSVYQKYNNQFHANPYNIEKENLPEYEKFKVGGDNEINYKDAVNKIILSFNEANVSIPQKLKSYNPKEYIRIYQEQNPETKAAWKQKYLECKCSFSSYEEFCITLLRYGTLSNSECHCRSTLYLRNKSYFTDKAEFDSYYDKGGNAVQLEIIKRQFNAMKIEKADLQNAKANSPQSPAQMRSNSGNAFAFSIITTIETNKSQPYFSEIIDYVIEKNVKLNKEWTKNGQFFESKTALYNAYISENYKQILKENKNR